MVFPVLEQKLKKILTNIEYFLSLKASSSFISIQISSEILQALYFSSIQNTVCLYSFYKPFQAWLVLTTSKDGATTALFHYLQPLFQYLTTFMDFFFLI